MAQMYSILGTIQLCVIKNTVMLLGLQLRPLKIKYLLLVPLTFTHYSCAYFSHISSKTLNPDLVGVSKARSYAYPMQPV